MIRPLYEIANEIQQDWGNKVSIAAKPYLAAMFHLDSINDRYYQDSAKGIVLYFLNNASTWRRPVARRIKEELKERVKSTGTF